MNARNTALAAGVIAALVAVFFFRPHATPGPPMRDFDAYYAAGAVANAGGDPYGFGVARYEHGPLLPFVSPPIVVPLFRALALLPENTAVIIWRVFLIACITALIVLSLRLCNRKIDAGSFFAAACIAIGFGPLTSALALGQLALPGFTAALASLTLPFAAFFVWIQPNFALAVFGQARLRAALWCLAGMIPAFAFSSSQYTAHLREHVAAERYSGIQLTPQAIAYGFGAAPRIADGIAIACALIAVIAIFAVIYRWRNPVQTFWVTALLLPFFVPFVHEHNLVVAFFPAVAALLLAPQRMWAVAAITAVLCAVDWLGLAQRPDGTAQTILLTVSLLLASWWLRRDVGARSIAVAVSAAIVTIFAASAIAAAHAMPVWPDGMQPLHATFASPAQQWHAEQAATGLFSREPVWSALRALSLLGCVALAYMSTFIMSSNGETAPG